MRIVDTLLSLVGLQQQPALSTTEKAPASPDAVLFSAAVKEETKELHRAAENAPLIKLIFSARITWPDYLNYLLALHPVYEALESAMELNKNHPVVSQFYFPRELNRTARVEQDIRFLMENPDQSVYEEALATARAGEAVEAYVSRIRQVSETDPTLLIAHAYSRYLGDLSGGQQIAKRIQKSLGLDVGSGLDFYEFPDVEDHVAFKDQFRALMDQLETNASVQEVFNREKFLEEAKLTFVLNVGVFNELMPPTTQEE
ncbi:heme oxygenase (decycling) 1 [Podochytrium sp. JEL0797]|nr:heme oxygenase (decycling) 1 [Podochytrium sp. JEL0797]